MSDSLVPFRELVQYALGGGWGAEAPIDQGVEVAIIRGTDFQRVRDGDVGALPVRWETRKRAERRFLREGDIVLEVSGGSSSSGQPTGRSLLVTGRTLREVDRPVIPASFCRLVRVDSAVTEPRYAYYALQDMYQSGRVREYEHQSTGISNFQFEYFLDAELVRLPPLHEQRRIADILSALDDKIELNRRMNHTLESIARAIFKSWFVDFDPVRGKMEGGEVGLPPDLAALFPKSFEPSPTAAGRIPRGWKVSEIGREVRIVGGSTPSTTCPAYLGGDIHFATPKDLAALASPVLLNTARRITEDGAAAISSGVLPPGTLLMSSRAPIGYLAIAEIPVCVNQGFIAMDCDGSLPNHYVLHWARDNMDSIVGNANGTTFLEISKRNFRPLPIVVPPRQVLDAFIDVAAPLHRRVVRALKENESLSAIRDQALPRLLDGSMESGLGAE